MGWNPGIWRLFIDSGSDRYYYFSGPSLGCWFFCCVNYSCRAGYDTRPVGALVSSGVTAGAQQEAWCIFSGIRHLHAGSSILSWVRTPLMWKHSLFCHRRTFSLSNFSLNLIADISDCMHCEEQCFWCPLLWGLTANTSLLEKQKCIKMWGFNTLIGVKCVVFQY